MILICCLLIPIAFAVACPLTWLMLRLAPKLGQMDAPGDRKIHDEPVPSLGGVAIFWAVVGPILVGMAAVLAIPAETWASIGVAKPVVAHLNGILGRGGMVAALLGSMTLMHIMGLIDDRRALGPWPKLAVQIVAAAIPVLFFNVRLLELAGPVGSCVVSILWFLAITNAFNFLDNMDGLSGGVGLICAALFGAAALITGQWFIAATLALLVGALGGFLVFNMPPARIFMGDGGSLVVGYLLAYCSIRITYVPIGAGWWVILAPLVILAIPIYDLLSVTALRLSQGKSPMVGDTQHFSHRLVQRGLSRRAAVATIWACTLATGLGGVMLLRLEHAWQAALVAAQTATILLVLGLMERSAHHERTP
jgi:UDP-GlcNAc:undecaprenyl-phosphate GlcNAc-1-phosphate transferase